MTLSDAEVQAKHPRLESEERSIPITRSKAYWFDDGSIVLQAESTQFRVHRTVLAQNSTVFSDMFLMPQSVTEPLEEGCPVVQLSDKAKEISHILDALYNGLRLYNAREPISFDSISSMIRMGRKYDIKLLRKEALARLELAFPTKFESAMKAVDDRSRYIKEYAGFEFDVVNLALECSIQTILPGAYFSCVTYELDAILNGIEDKISLLNPAARTVCLLGDDKIEKALREYTLSWFISRPKMCTKPKCSLAILKRMTQLWSAAQGAKIAFIEWDAFRCEDLCITCEVVAKKEYEAGRRKLWQDLPSMFSLPPWGELKNAEG